MDQNLGSEQMPQKLQAMVLSLLRETWLTSWELIRITVPVVIITKILEELHLIGYLSILLKPIMVVLGLPDVLGLAWATAILTNIYGGIAAFSVLAAGLELTGSQVTVFCTLMLIAHSLPVELSISSRAGAKLMPILIIRMAGAMVYGFLLNRFCLYFHLWQEKARIVFTETGGQTDNLNQWILAQLTNLGVIIAIIFCILTGMRILKRIGLIDLLERLLAPVLPWFGMTRRAAPMTVIGMILGISYGGSLIIRESMTGKINREEVFYAMALMGLSHSLVEDTLLMVAIGARFSGVFWGRILFALVVTFFLVKAMQVWRSCRVTH
jgi:hypothetical protein